MRFSLRFQLLLPLMIVFLFGCKHDAKVEPAGEPATASKDECESSDRAPSSLEIAIPSEDQSPQYVDENIEVVDGVGEPIRVAANGNFTLFGAPDPRSRSRRKKEYYDNNNFFFGNAFKAPGEGCRGNCSSANKGSSAWTTLMTALKDVTCNPDNCVPAPGSCALTKRCGSSCHNSGRAVDLMGLKCGDRLVKPQLDQKTEKIVKRKNGRSYKVVVHKAMNPEFDKFVTCFKKFFKCYLWQKAAHFDHAHLSNGCSERGC